MFWRLVVSSVPLQRGREFRGDLGDQGHHLPSRTRRVEATGYLQELLRNRRRIFSIRRADVRSQIW